MSLLLSINALQLAFTSLFASAIFENGPERQEACSL
jgi:hypothetical protein